MKTLFLAFTALCAFGIKTLTAQSRPLTVCEALNHAADHQPVVIRGLMGWAGIYEGTGNDVCPGWPEHLFTAEAMIPISGSYGGVSVPRQVSRENFNFFARLRQLLRSNPNANRMITVRGVFVRLPWPFCFRNWKGAWINPNDDGPGIGAVAVIVATAPMEATA